MSKKRYINDCIREDNYIMDLDPSEKFLFIYLLTNNKVSICGIYEIHLRKIAMETWFDKDMIEKVLNRFEKYDKIYYRNGYVFITNFLKNQSLNDNMKKWVERELKELNSETLQQFCDLKGFERLWKALKAFGILNLTLLNLTLPNLSEDGPSDIDITEDSISVPDSKSVTELKDFISKWNKIKKIKWKKWFIWCRWPTKDLIKERKRCKSIYWITGINEWVRAYIEEIKKRPDDSYQLHRFSLYEFLKQANWLKRFYHLAG